MPNETRVALLLERLKARNEEDKERGPQTIEPAESPADTIQTLSGEHQRPLSPMLMDRFRFCGTWNNAHLSQDWLSLSQINDWRANAKLVEWVDLSIENSFGPEPPGGVDSKDCAIFGYNPHEPEETYLVWHHDEVEPKVWSFFQGDYSVFSNFERYLEFILGERESDDSGR